MLLLALVGPQLLSGCHTVQKADPVDTSAPVQACEAQEPPAEALVKAGIYDGLVVLPDGRTLTPAGLQSELGGFPADVALATTSAGARVGLVTNVARDWRRMEVIDLTSGALLSETDRTDAFPGIAVDGQRIYASGGHSNLVDEYDLGDDGSLTLVSSISPGAYPTGLHLSADRSVLYVALFQDHAVAEVDVATGAVLQTFPTTFNPYGLALSPDGLTAWATGFGDDRIAVIDLSTGEVELITVGGNPAGVVVAPDGTAYVAVTNEDTVLALDGTSHVEVGRVDLREAEISGDEGALSGTSPSSLALSPDGTRLYVTRAGDNAVGVVDTGSMSVLGNIPLGWYPTGIALSDQTLLVSNGKGLGSGPNPDGTSASDSMVGTANVIELDESRLPVWTQQVADNIARPNTIYDFGDCVGTFPIPRTVGDLTPIQHVILMVRENKTYDSVLGDLELPDADRDASLSQWPQVYTPNLHALVTQFTNHDNFYDNSESSVQGHLWLTSSFVNEYMERAWIEDYHGVSTFADDSATSVGRPVFGTIFTHLIHHGVDMRNYGEIVGSLDSVDGIPVMSKTDLAYPGGFFNTEVSDEEKATYAADQLFTRGDFPPFVYISLPNDHGGGPYVDGAMIADNDYGTGIFVDALTRSDYWQNTVLFIVEDDPQSAVDHVDAHRSILVIVSPWAKHGYTSHVMASYPSIFKTIEQILGVPPMNRYDALATPLYDAFTSVPDESTFTLLPRTIDNHGNPEGPVAPPDVVEKEPGALRAAAAAHACLDLSGPDRNPYLLDIQYAERFGRLPANSILHQTTECATLQRWGETSESGDGDDDAYDDAWRGFTAWKAKHPGVADGIVRPARPAWMELEEEPGD